MIWCSSFASCHNILSMLMEGEPRISRLHADSRQHSDPQRVRAIQTLGGSSLKVTFPEALVAAAHPRGSSRPLPHVCFSDEQAPRNASAA